MSYDKELITAQALAAALNLSVETIWRYTREKKIPYVELGKKQYRYNLEEVVKALSTSPVREKTAEYKSDKEYTYDDYLQLPEEPGYRFEILEGTLVKEPSPNVTHQRVIRRLVRMLEDYFWQVDTEGEVFISPLDVTLGNLTVVQPDLFYISGKQKSAIEDQRIDGAPTLAVEILSPTTSRKDRMQKRQIYQKAGVQHYWLVSPEDKTFECFVLRDGFYAVAAQGMDDEVLEHPNFPGLSVPLKELWHNP
ncbi:Uma2 family endonuclease [Dethiobacter alkaliphilus]|uniref:DNA binding domain protein, excisionase family n=1 Tax=Dethiobacter alkaliphilus AHT 1 TaxID=555088 RepID=C0GCJ2_DETAL|nr:Uma2 family endonuclease [Dethiobacter alkaliphilus]EEG78927.1 protein of unknown function DUF820 [Dethiobacter alkaliphilus AHT 1]